MERYNEYKDSGVYFIPDIPNSWQVLKAKYLFKQEKREVCPEDEIVTCFRDGQVTLRKNRRTEGFTNSMKEIGYQGVRKGDLVIHNMDAFAGAIGVSDSDGKGTPVYACCTPKRNDINQYYYCYLLRYLARNGFILSLAKGIRERSTDFRFNDFKELYLPVPSKEEQDAIVSYIDLQSTKIDEAIAQQQKMIDLLNERKQIIINNAVTKGLNPDAPMKDSGVDWIGEIPEHWEVMPIKRLKSKEKNAFVDGPFGSNLKSEHFVENGDVYVIESGLITTGKYVHRELKTITKSHFETIKRSECKANDIIIAKIGARFGMAGELPELGKPCVVSGNSLKLTLDQSVMQNGMFVNYMGLAKWKGGFVGLYQETAQPALSLGALNNMMLPVPPIEEQLYILEQTSQKLDILDVAIINASKQISLLQERKQIIINDVVTGKVKVS